MKGSVCCVRDVRDLAPRGAASLQVCGVGDVGYNYFDFFVTGCSDFPGSSVRKCTLSTLKFTMNGSLVSW